jgi:hypothetical protein
MPIMLPAPALFSTKNGWPSALDKCCASTRARMSVPPPGRGRHDHLDRTDRVVSLAHCISKKQKRD